jgi:hypothetical protein
MVERGPEKAGVGGSIPSLGISRQQLKGRAHTTIPQFRNQGVRPLALATLAADEGHGVAPVRITQAA